MFLPNINDLILFFWYNYSVTVTIQILNKTNDGLPTIMNNDN